VGQHLKGGHLIRSVGRKYSVEDLGKHESAWERGEEASPLSLMRCRCNLKGNWEGESPQLAGEESQESNVHERKQKKLMYY